MTQALRFSVLGADNKVYEVAIERHAVNHANLKATCSCAGGDDACIHKLEIIEGDTGNVVSNNLADLHTLRDWIKGSDIEVAMKNLSKAKTELRLAYEKVDQCRRMLVRRMAD